VAAIACSNYDKGPDLPPTDPCPLPLALLALSCAVFVSHSGVRVPVAPCFYIFNLFEIKQKYKYI